MITPCDDAVIQSASVDVPCSERAGRWILAATILGSSMAFIDGTVVNVALPALQENLHATVVGVQWVVESYGLFLGALILVGGSLGDLFGRRLLFLRFACGSILLVCPVPVRGGKGVAHPHEETGFIQSFESYVFVRQFKFHFLGELLGFRKCTIQQTSKPSASVFFRRSSVINWARNTSGVGHTFLEKRLLLLQEDPAVILTE